MKSHLAAIGAFAVLVGTLPGAAVMEKQSAQETDAGVRDDVGIQIRNVNLRLTHDIVLGVRSLQGRLQPTRPGVPVTFDDSDSFSVDVDSAEIHVTSASLTALMNQYVFAYRGAPIKNVAVMFEAGRLIQTGTVRKGVDVPFRIEATASVTEDGRVRIHADKIKAGHLSVKGLLSFFGEDLEKLIHENPGRGVQAVGNDLILSPAALMPAPHVHGRVIRVSVLKDALVLVFDSGRHSPVFTPPVRTAAYIYHHGGTLRFGKLTMNDADLEIVGNLPGTFDFFQREYLKQLVAGYTKTTPANGLVVHMVDFSRVESYAVKRTKGSGDR